MPPPWALKDLLKGAARGGPPPSPPHLHATALTSAMIGSAHKWWHVTANALSETSDAESLGVDQWMFGIEVFRAHGDLKSFVL